MKIEMFKSTDFYSIEEYTQGFMIDNEVTGLKFSSIYLPVSKEVEYHVIIFYKEHFNE